MLYSIKMQNFCTKFSHKVFAERSSYTDMTNIRDYLKDRNGQAGDEYQKKISAHKRKVRIVIIIIILALVAIAVGIKIYIDNKSYSEYEITDTRTISGAGSNKYFQFGDGMLVYTDDGISYIKGRETIWNQAFEMKKPIVDVCGSTMAVCDLNTTTVYIYDTEGQKGKIDTMYPIIALEVSEQGVVAAITEDTETNRIEVFDREGNSIAAGQTYVTGEGCPIDIALSNDGTKLAASYIYVDGGSAKSKVVFYNYSEVGKNEVSRIVGGFNHYETTIVSRVEFLDNDTAAAFGDNIITIYSIKQKPEKISETKTDNTIKSIFYDEKYIGIVSATASYEKPYNIKVYDVNGNEKMSMDTDFIYTGISMYEDRIIVYNDTEMKLFSISGRERYSGAITEGIRQVICTDRADKYYIINGEYNIMSVKLK